MTSTEKDGARSVPKLTPKGAGAPKSFFFPPGVMLSNRSSVHETTEEVATSRVELSVLISDFVFGMIHMTLCLWLRLHRVFSITFGDRS